MKRIFWVLILFMFCGSLIAQDVEGFDDSDADIEMVEDDVEFESEDEFSDDESETNTETESSMFDQLMSPARFTIKHELSYQLEKAEAPKNNRTSFRLEYSKFFGTYFFIQLDTKVNVFHGNDHRAKAENSDVVDETHTKEAFLQMSFGNTSIKLGMQNMIWGEADGGAITDVISPRDYSELFFISLEESRIGQVMMVVDQFTEMGDWSLFFIPDPKLNEYPKEGTAYYYDPFGGQAVFQEVSTDEDKYEYGLRWKKTFGKSDISLMTASLLENDWAVKWVGVSATTGKQIFIKSKQRYTMTGTAFNYAQGNFLYKGEIAQKTPRSFNNAVYQIVKKDVLDAALGVEYSPGGSYTLGLEAVNSHVIDWEEGLQDVREDTAATTLSWSNTYFNEDLSVSWMSSIGNSLEMILHSLRTSYKWDDNLTFELNAFYPDVRDEKSEYWVYLDQKQVALKAQVQF